MGPLMIVFPAKRVEAPLLRPEAAPWRRAVSAFNVQCIRSCKF
jgi:hypothetical protein